MPSDISNVIRSSDRPVGLVLLWGFVVFVVAMVFIVSRAAGNTSAAWMHWFARAMWLIAAYLVVLAAFATWRAVAHGTALLRLDDASPRGGDWLSGTIELTKLPRAVTALHVECVRSSMDVDRSKNIRTVMWRSIVILDPERFVYTRGHHIIPFAVLLPGGAHPTLKSETTDVDWTVRIEGGAFAKEFAVHIHPADASSQPADSNPPRITPELTANRLAVRTTTENGATIHLPFPFISFSLALLFLGIAISIAVDRDAATRSEMEVSAVFIGGFLLLSAFMLLVVALTPRRVEIEEEKLRIARGLMGLGFHSTIMRGDVVKVEETAPVDATSTAFYGVHLHTRDGRVHVAAARLKDPARAKGVAAAISSALNVKSD